MNKPDIKDTAQKILDADKNVSGMILNLGGSSVMSYGSKPDGSAWQVAVTDPRDTEGDYLGVVTLNGYLLPEITKNTL